MVVRDTEQPRQEPTAGRLIRRRLAPQFEKRLLDDLFGRRAVGQQAQREGVDAAAVALVQLLQGAGVASSDGFDQISVVAERSTTRS